MFWLEESCSSFRLQNSIFTHPPSLFFCFGRRVVAQSKWVCQLLDTIVSSDSSLSSFYKLHVLHYFLLGKIRSAPEELGLVCKRGVGGWERERNNVLGFFFCIQYPFAYDHIFSMLYFTIRWIYSMILTQHWQWTLVALLPVILGLLHVRGRGKRL